MRYEDVPVYDSQGGWEPPRARRKPPSFARDSAPYTGQNFAKQMARAEEQLIRDFAPKKRKRK